MVGERSRSRWLVLAERLIATAVFGLLLLETANALDGSSTGSFSSPNFSGFYPAIYVDNFTWCSNQQLTGNYCEDWYANCKQVAQVAYGQLYTAYVGMKDIVHGGKYNYTFAAYYTPPGGSEQFGGSWNFYGSQTVDSRCQQVNYPGNSFAQPAGTWNHHFKIADWPMSSTAHFEKTIAITCSQDNQCTPGFVCKNNLCTGLPDLTVSNLYLTPQQPLADLTTDFTIVEKNIGKGDINSPNNKWYSVLSADGGVVGSDYYHIEDLPVGMETSFSKQSTFGEGNYTLRARTDYKNDIAEWNEFNNDYYRNMTVVKRKIDLNITAVLNPSPPVGGENASLAITEKDTNGTDILQPTLTDIIIDGQKTATYTVFAIPGTGITFRHYLILQPGTHAIKIVGDSSNTLSLADPTHATYSQNTNWLAPSTLSQSVAGLQTDYYTGDSITATITVKDSSGNALAGATVNLHDSLGNDLVLTTDPNGKANYATTASKPGLQYAEIRSSKYAYTTALQRYSFKVTDYNARITATVHTPQNKPIPNALLYRGTTLRATTNYNGTASFTTTRGLNNIAAYCPDQTYCTSQLTDVQNTSYLDFTCSCKLGILKVIVDDQQGYPIGNVLVVVNGEYAGATNPLGYLIVQNLPFTNQTVELILNVTNPDFADLYAGTRTVALNASVTEARFNVSAFGQSIRITTLENGNSTSIEVHKVNKSIIGQIAIIPAVIAIGAAIVVAYDVNNYCSCIYEDSATKKFGLQECFDTLASCRNAGLSNTQCKERLRKFDLTTNKCSLDAAFVVADAAMPLVPKGLIGHFGIIVAGTAGKTADSLKIVDAGKPLLKTAEGAIDYAKGNIEFLAKWTEGIDDFIKAAKLKVFQTLTWSPLARNGLNAIAEKMAQTSGLNALEKYLIENGGETYAKTITEAMGNLLKREADGQIKDKGASNLAKKIAGFSDYLAKAQTKNLADPKTINQITRAEGNLKGALFEAEGAANSKYANEIIKLNAQVGNKEVDALLEGERALEIKTGGLLSGPDGASKFAEVIDEQFRKDLKQGNFNQVIFLVKEMSANQKEELIKVLRNMKRGDEIDKGVLVIEQFT